MGALSCSSPSLIAVPGVCPSPCGMGAGGVGSACSWHLPRRSTRDTSALISSVAPGCCPQGRHDASGGPAVGTSHAEGGACGDVWGSESPAVQGWGGVLWPAVGGPGLWWGPWRPGPGPVPGLGAWGMGWGCRRIPKAGPAGSAAPLSLWAAGRPHGRPCWWTGHFPSSSLGPGVQMARQALLRVLRVSSSGQEPPSAGSPFSVALAKLYCN